MTFETVFYGVTGVLLAIVMIAQTLEWLAERRREREWQEFVRSRKVVRLKSGHASRRSEARQ